MMLLGFWIVETFSVYTIGLPRSVPTALGCAAQAVSVDVDDLLGFTVQRLTDFPCIPVG